MPRGTISPEPARWPLLLARVMLAVLSLLQGASLGIALTLLLCLVRTPTAAERQWIFLVPWLVMATYAAVVIVLAVRSQRRHGNARPAAAYAVLALSTVPPALLFAADARLWLSRSVTLAYGHTRGPGPVGAEDPLMSLLRSVVSAPIESVLFIFRAVSAVVEPLLDRLAFQTLVASSIAVLVSLAIWLALRARLRAA